MISGAEQREFDTFVQSSSDRLLRTAYLLTGSTQDAEDLVQTALMRTAQHWRKAKEAPYPYARTAVVNLAKDRWRYLGRRPSQSALEIETLGVRCLVAESELDRVFQRDVVLRALHTLPPRQRAVIVLRYLEDLTVRETARILGCTTGTVKTQASRALDRLRSALEPPAGPGSFDVGAGPNAEKERRHAHR